MPAPSPDELWQLLVRSRLLEPAAAAALRADYAAAPAAEAGAGGAGAIAGWLTRRGVITPWQAKRLLIGDPGPFFLGDYRLLERHEREGDALQFTARHEPSGRLVTVVLLSAKRVRDPEVWSAIVARVTAAERATDPTTTRTWSLERQAGARFIVCELVTGTSMADEIERLGPLPPQQAAAVAWQVAKAVGELHAAGGVHGSLSLDAVRREPPPAGGPERNGRVRLLQFPLAGDPYAVAPAAAGGDDQGPGRLGRRAAFVPPELARSGGRADPRSDVYSIGCMLQALLSGRPPGRDEGRAAAVNAAAAVDPASLPAAVPQPLRDVVARMTAHDPGRRYRDAGEAAGAIASAIGLATPAHGQAVPRTARASTVRTRRPTTWLGLAAALAAAAAVAAMVAVVTIRSGRPPAAPDVVLESGPRNTLPAGEADRPVPPPAAEPRPAAPPAGDLPSAPVAAAELVVESADLPWASPTHGPPPPLAYLPPGSQLVLLARLAEIEADDEGRRFVKSLGPGVEAARDVLVNLCGGHASAIELVQAGWQAGDADEPVVGWAAWFAEGHAAPAGEAARSAAYGTTTSLDVDGETVHQTATLSLWAPAAREGRVLVIAPRVMVPRDDGLHADRAEEPLITRIIRETKPLAADRQAPLQTTLPGDLETLVGMLDGERHLTLLAAPHYLFTSGRPLLAGPFARLLDPLETVLGDGIQAAAVSLHFGERSYVELDAVATLDVPARTLAPRLTGRLEGMAAATEAFCAALDADPYGRTLVLRLPAMLRVLTAQLRSGAEGKAVVLNAYLPRHAPHNVALAAELALAQTPGGSVAAAGALAGPPPRHALEKLRRRMTLAFAKDNLERSIQMVADETGVPMEILGGDLELEGITKNQSFGLDERDETAEEILRVILAKASPEGKLVYVVEERDGVEWVVVTTSAAAEKRAAGRPPASAPASK